MGRKKGIGRSFKSSRTQRKSNICLKWAVSGEYNDTLIIKCRKVKKSSSFWVVRENTDDVKNASEITKKSSSLDIVGEINHSLPIQSQASSLPVHPLNRSRSSIPVQPRVTDNTGLMDEVDGSKSDNTPATSDKYTSIEGHPFSFSKLCIPCTTNDSDSMSSLSLSTDKRESNIGKIGQVDALVNEILQSPERTMSTIQPITPKYPVI